jgi:hypothetical protein
VEFEGQTKKRTKGQKMVDKMLCRKKDGTMDKQFLLH